MKTRITLAMIMFIGFVLCSTVVAYMPMLIIRECPHCKAHVVQEETVSGNTIGATLLDRWQARSQDAAGSSMAGKVSDVQWSVLGR